MPKETTVAGCHSRASNLGPCDYQADALACHPATASLDLLIVFANQQIVSMITGLCALKLLDCFKEPDGMSMMHVYRTFATPYIVTHLIY